MSDLKLCPFCGGEAVLKEQHHVPNGYDYTPTCLNSSCSGRITKKWINKEDAIKAWNRRAEPEMKWIPVTEALPEDRQKVLCVNKHGEMMVGGYSTDYGMTFPCYFEKPIAWMPLPELAIIGDVK